MDRFLELTENPGFLRIAGITFGISALLLWISLVVWTVKDSRARSRDILVSLISGLLVLILTIPGFFIYLLLRPQDTIAQKFEKAVEEEVLLNEIKKIKHCPDCNFQAQPEWLVCPYCGRILKNRCTNCNEILEIEWDHCPICGRKKE